MAHLFSELQRRHPDVDLVLLPPDPVVPDPPEAPDDVVASTLIRTASALRQLWSAVAPGNRTEPVVRWSYAADAGWVRATARVVDKRPDGLGVLIGLRHELESDGWEVERPPGDLERLTGVLDDLDLAASWSESSGALLLTVSSRPVFVGRDRAPALTRAR